MEAKARILFLDIETAPSLGWVWGKWQQDVIEFQETWYLLSFAYKWSDSDKIYVCALPDFPEYKKSLDNDFYLVEQLWGVMDEADIIIAHNGDSFDIKKANARFVTHGFAPPSSFKTVDTLKLARKYFKFESNKLTDLGQALEVGEKSVHTGFKLWKGCMQGDKDSWATMKKYNAQDVRLLEQIYFKLRPWAVTHPDLNLYSKADACPTCQSENVQRRGFAYAKSVVRQRFQCTDCGTWYSGKVVKKDAP